jgi:hypothetical protein
MKKLAGCGCLVAVLLCWTSGALAQSHCAVTCMFRNTTGGGTFPVTSCKDAASAAACAQTAAASQGGDFKGCSSRWISPGTCQTPQGGAARGQSRANSQ